MVTHGKKAHPKKKRTGAEERAERQAPAQELPAELASGGTEVPAQGPGAAAAEAQVPASPVVDLTPPELVQPAASATAGMMDKGAAEATEEPDFGLGIGDILRGEEEIKTKKVDLERTAEDAKGDEGKLSIEDILNRGGAPAPSPKPMKKKFAPLVRPPARERSGAGKNAPLVALVLLCFAAAAAGIYMFMKKNGLPSFPSKKPAATSQAPAPAPAVEAPSSVSVNVLVGPTAKPSGEKPFLVSRVIETDVKGSESFTATGTSTTTAGRATGKATIINTTSKAYTFVATTRLLSKDGVLFRMKATTPIPASGSVTVDVYADQAGPAGDIGPTTFTIPGLPPDLQRVITAKSDAAMTGGSGKATVVTAEDVGAAKARLAEKLKKDALDNFAVMVTADEKLSPDLTTSKEIASSAPKPGTAGTKFTVSVTLRFRALLLPEKALAPYLAKALTDALAGKDAADFSLGAPLYTVHAYDTASETAEVRAEAPVIRR